MVNSTIADIQAERDHLHDFDFPRPEEKLREWRHLFEQFALPLGVDTVSLLTNQEREFEVLKVCLEMTQRTGRTP